jgi:hypothetical protein
MKKDNKLFRITNHKTPRYQLYQPGFNPNNSCWLPGEWITLSKKDWLKQKSLHCKMYANLQEETNKQYYRNKGTALKNMSAAQKQAYEFYSGDAHFDVIYEAGYHGAVKDYYGVVSVKMAGKFLMPSQEKWLRARHCKIIKNLKNSYTNKIENQTKGYSLPKDLIIDNPIPLDFEKNIVDQNMQQSEDIFFFALEEAIKDSLVSSFAALTVFGLLLEQENLIISSDWKASKGQPDVYYDKELEKQRYANMREALEKVENWKTYYDEHKLSHNNCERENLDNSDGELYAFVLPEFHSDGTYEPWGDKDVPWGIKDLEF